MKTSGLREILLSAFQEFFAGNTAAKGSRTYYGVAVSNVRKSGTRVAFDLTLTFKKGKRYCCFEDGCHHWLFSKDGWQRVRALMRENGGVQPGPLRMATLFGRVEKGARANYGGMPDRRQELVTKTYRYRAGPYDERKASD